MRKIFSTLATVAVLTTAVFCQTGKNPKNIILLIGDGMGLNAVTASVLSLENDPFKKFRTIGLVKTCPSDVLITDSAAGATALATGNKTSNGRISFSTEGMELKTLMEYAEESDYSTGIVATYSFTNATPAGFYAHNISRKNENQIAAQIFNSGIDVVLSGGSDFLSTKISGSTVKDSITFLDSLRKTGYSFSSTYEELLINKNNKKLFAALANYALPKSSERNYSLGDLTSIALSNLSQNENGFVLMVEGSQIDKGAEYNDYDFMIGELKDFNSAVNAALDFAEKDGNTLVVVTADHESGGLAILGSVKNKIEPKWAVKKSHTAAMVGIFSKGPGEHNFMGILENNEVGQILINLLNTKKSSK